MDIAAGDTVAADAVAVDIAAGDTVAADAVAVNIAVADIAAPDPAKPEFEVDKLGSFEVVGSTFDPRRVQAKLTKRLARQKMFESA